MIRIIFLMILWCDPFLELQAQTRPIATANSEVRFEIRNAGIKAEGTFSNMRGSIRFHPDSLALASFRVTVDAATINTGIRLRDNHLKKKDYFDVERYPLLSFKSIKVSASGTGSFLLTGLLTAKAVSQEVVIPFHFTNGVFYGEFNINRLNFGIGGNSLTISDDVTIRLSVTTTQ